jgi:hypothetical protein
MIRVPTAVSNHKKNQCEINEDDSLQLALAISRSEADEKERQKKILTQKYATTITTVETKIESNEPDEIDQFTTLVTDHINNFKLRMLSNQHRHRNITTDTAVQSIFLTLQYSYPELSRLIQLLEDKQSRK